MQPDALLLLDPAHGGACRVNGQGYLVGAPELVLEVTSSSVSFDLGAKKNVYRRAGVCEYLVWRVLEDAEDWFINQDGVFVALPIDAAGVGRSTVFPGLWLDVPAALRGDLAAIVRTLSAGLASAEHADFVRRLGQGRA